MRLLKGADVADVFLDQGDNIQLFTTVRKIPVEGGFLVQGVRTKNYYSMKDGVLEVVALNDNATIFTEKEVRELFTNSKGFTTVPNC